MNPVRENLRGILAMIAANFVFLLNDTQVKLAGEGLPMGEIIVVRGILASVLIGIVAVALGQHRSAGVLIHPTLAWRTVGEIGATVLYLTALFRMPITDITAILQVLPLMITAAGALFLAERVGWRRWTAIAVGFVGVVIVLRPGGDGFNVFGLVALAAMLFITLRDLSTRLMPAATPTMLVAALASIATTLSGVVIGIGEVWLRPDLPQLGLIGGAAVFIAAGYWLIVQAMRHGEIAVIAPFRYSVIVWASAAGYLIWGDVPDVATIVGTAIIIATGIYAFMRERRHDAVELGVPL